MPATLRITLAVPLLLAALTAGCGGGASPQEVARDFLATDEPAKCKVILPELLERQTGRRGEDALRFCEANAGLTPPAKDIRVVESETVAGVVVVEMVVDQREERIGLVKRDGRWRIADFPR